MDEPQEYHAKKPKAKPRNYTIPLSWDVFKQLSHRNSRHFGNSYLYHFEKFRFRNVFMRVCVHSVNYFKNQNKIFAS